MMATSSFELAFQHARHLVANFDNGKAHYLSASYQEEEARRDFIDKFWQALGWDVNHEVQINPYMQEVKVERGVLMSEGRKRADYAFYMAPDFQNVRFFVEAKKPSVDLASRDNYFQAARYGWNGNTPLAVLTDFEELHVLDCRTRPDIDTALERAVMKHHYSGYSDKDRFAEIYFLFGREAVAQRSIDAYVEQHLEKPNSRAFQRGLFHGGFQSIDAAFLHDLDSYRSILARAFKAANPHLNSETLTEATQRVLDRLVFMRFLEDKCIEPAPLVASLMKQGATWRNFQTARMRLDQTYNGTIFKPHLIDYPGFGIEDSVFASICHELASDHAPYLFNIIPIHILGSIYERFLGKVIVVEGAEARVEVKPEVRKAGGVYYTPEYIVRYIVKQTVGRAIEGKTPAEIAPMRFADISCGSGSFLLGVYDELVRYHTAWYNAHKREAHRAGCEAREGGFYLSLWQKREILERNIYGVDIDAQAVEVAQMSLYLKMLEEETISSARDQLLLHGALLPSLHTNIVCGNSLIGWDIFEEGEEEKKLNPMHFEDVFPTIMRQGGFDAIVGNPPYVRIQGAPRNQIKYFAQRYAAAVGNYDLYVNFIERGYSLLNPSGHLGQIVPNKFFRTDYGRGLRQFITKEKALAEVVDFGAEQVFEATTYTTLLFLNKEPQTTYRYGEAHANAEALHTLNFVTKSSETLRETPWTFVGDAAQELLEKLRQGTRRLLDVPATMSRGSSSGDDSVFLVNGSDHRIEESLLRTPIFATDFGRYHFRPAGSKRILFPYHVANGVARLYAETELQENFPLAYAYLLSHRPALERRKQFAQWYGFSAPRNLALHDQAQIIVPLLADRGLFAAIPQHLHGNLCPMASGGFTLSLPANCALKPEYVLGVLNSRLLFWVLRQMSNVFRGGWITCTKQYFGELPIHCMVPSDADWAYHDSLVHLVTQLQVAIQQKALSQTDKDNNFFARKMSALERQIEEIVYTIYGLSAREIALVQE